MDASDLKSRLRPSPGGAAIVLGLFAFGAIVLGALFLSPKAHPPRLPADAKTGVPQRTLRFVSYDLAHQHPANDPVFRDIARLHADIIFLQGVDEDDALRVVEMLNFQSTFHPQLYQRSEFLAGKRGTWGNLILSPHAIYDGSSLGGVRGGFGAWASGVVDGCAFPVANLHLSAGDQGSAEWAEFQRIWKSRGSPPIVVAVLAGDDRAPAAGEFQIVRPAPSGPYFCFTHSWTLTGQGQAASAVTGDWPSYVELSGKP